MNDATQHHPELDNLLATLVEGSLSLDQRVRLRELLRGNPSAQAYYRHYLNLHIMLERQMGTIVEPHRQDPPAPQAQPVSQPPPAKPAPAPTEQARLATEPRTHKVLQIGPIQVVRRPRSGRYRIEPGHLAWVAGIGVMITLSVLLMREPPTTDSPPSPGEIARVVDATDARWHWDGKGDGPKAGRSLHAGELQLISGVAQLEMANGTQVVLEAPIALELQRENQIRLHNGRLVARIDGHGESFTVVAPSASIRDLGTEFGVQVDESGDTETVVFHGRVELRAGNDNVPALLDAGLLASVSAAGQMTAKRPIEPQDQRRYQRNLFPLVERVETNSPAGTYPVLRHGLEEDVKAFSDRTHEWNGVDERGMPAYLKGAHLIRPRADDKYDPDLRVDIHLSRPATLYVFYDTRLPTPAWLRRDFERMPELIGMDEGPWEGSLVDRTLGRGPGVSIDGQFEIWRREVDEAGKFTLRGVDSEDLISFAMFGVAVQPQERP